jgi:hypothetical protein
MGSVVLIGRDLVMTCRHVVAPVMRPAGPSTNGRWRLPADRAFLCTFDNGFQRIARAGADCLFWNPDTLTGALDTGVLDIVVMQLEPATQGRGPEPLDIDWSQPPDPGTPVAVIGFPTGIGKTDLFGDRYYERKGVSPGFLRADTLPGGLASICVHDANTLKGHSGGALVTLEQHPRLIGLHFGFPENDNLSNYAHLLGAAGDTQLDRLKAVLSP